MITHGQEKKKISTKTCKQTKKRKGSLGMHSVFPQRTQEIADTSIQDHIVMPLQESKKKGFFK